MSQLWKIIYLPIFIENMKLLAWSFLNHFIRGLTQTSMNQKVKVTFLSQNCKIPNTIFPLELTNPNTRFFLGRCKKRNQVFFFKNIVLVQYQGRSGLCVFVYMHVIVGDIVHCNEPSPPRSMYWRNPFQLQNGMPSKG